MVTSAFLFEDSFPDDSTFNKCIAVTATLYLFFFGNYLMNFMSSELIVFPAPHVMSSYDDILEWYAQGKNLTIILPPGLPESEKFALAPEGSVMKQLWDAHSPGFSFDLGTEGILAKFGTELLKDFRVVTILRDTIARAVAARGFYLGGKLEMGGVDALFAIDDSATDTTYPSVIPIGKHLDPFLKDVLLKALVLIA